MKKVAISQSNYIPWKGYFDLIAAVDEFVLYDDMQYTRRDWRNRNIIVTPDGPRWLTVPVKTRGKYYQRIDETQASGTGWRAEHWRTLQRNYSAAPFFEMHAPLFGSLYAGSDETLLSKINFSFLTAICRLLGISTKLSWSTDYAASGRKTERLLDLCLATGASHYLSGPAARSYIEPAMFAQAGITLEYIDYSGYRPYKQLYGAFDHAVSVLDLIFNVGDEAPHYMKHVLSTEKRI